VTWKLFLDDKRYPKERDYIISRTFDDAVSLIEAKGMPCHIAFDHDLGMISKDGMEFAKWFADYCFENKNLPEGFTFSVHSANPVGAENITCFMNNFLRIYNEENQSRS
jgi:hypothetical protein